MQRKNGRLLLILKLAIIGLYLMALWTEAFEGSGGVVGVFALVFGALSILVGNLFAFLAWSANILFFIVLLRKKRWELKRNLSGIAVLLGLCSLFVTSLPIHMGSSTSPVSVGLGFYFWMASLVLLFLKSLIELKIQNKKYNNKTVVVS